MKAILILICTLLTGACMKAQNESAYNENKISKAINEIVTEIANFNKIHGRAIGIGGIKSDQYKRFEKLCEIASTDELLELMNHPNSVVKGYSFWALAKRYYSDLEKIYISYANNNQPVFTQNGCIGGDVPLYYFLRGVVKPNSLDSECKKLDERLIKSIDEKRMAPKND